MSMKKSTFTPILISGGTGNMATRMVLALLDDDRYLVIPYTLVGPEVKAKSVEIKPRKGPIKVLQTIGIRNRAKKLRELADRFPGLVIVDYSQPAAVNRNARLFCKLGIPFIMGTTGGNRGLLIRTVKKSATTAVISPNMSPDIVIFISMIEYAAKTFPNALQGRSIKIVESHQAGKPDFSGTAIAVGTLLKELGVKFEGTKSISKIRTAIVQRSMGIPEEFLGGHGWHTYQIKSPDGTVLLEFTHNVNGRQTYVDGTKLAIPFLVRKVLSGAARGECYSMTDVLKEQPA